MTRTNSARISPTAHYTSYVWYRNGLSYPAFATATGRAMFWSMEPFNRLSSLSNGGLTLERFLLQRHMIIDHRLRVAVRSGAVGQVIEVACGLSPRGVRMTREFPTLRYIEADLPDMARMKSVRLSTHGLWGPDHQVVAVDALSDEGPTALATVAAAVLQKDVGTAVITEGLVNYFDGPTVTGMWRRFAALIAAQGKRGVYLSDLHLTRDAPNNVLSRVFRAGLGRFSGGETHYGFEDEAEATQALHEGGFDDVTFHAPRDYGESLGVPQTKCPDVQRVVEARLG